MSNFGSELYDISSIVKDIEERKQVILRYQLTGYLDRDDAIRKIQALRLTDTDIAVATAASLAVSSTPFDKVPDQGIISELQMQTDILTAKLAQKTE